MRPLLQNDAELYFGHGGTASRLFLELTRRLPFRDSLRNRILGFLLITWAPLLCFALLEDRATGRASMQPLLLDFGTYARFFLGLPLLLCAESLVGPQLRRAGLQFVDGGFVRAEDYPAFDRGILRAARLRDSVWAELAILALSVTGAWLFTTENLAKAVTPSWRSPTGSSTGSGLSLTVLWYRLIALPLLQFVWYRWLWRLFCWACFLWSVSKLDLRLVATHADRAGGLGFLGTAHMTFAIFSLALCSVLCAETAFLMVFREAGIESFKSSFIAFLITAEVIILGPLFLFVPLLARARLTALRDYSLLISRYNRAFHDKWIKGEASPDERLLGSADIQSLADLANSFERIREMKAFPFSLRVVIQLAVVTSIPCAPLILLVMPLNEVLSLLSKAVF